MVPTINDAAEWMLERVTDFCQAVMHHSRCCSTSWDHKMLIFPENSWTNLLLMPALVYYLIWIHPGHCVLLSLHDALLAVPVWQKPFHWSGIGACSTPTKRYWSVDSFCVLLLAAFDYVDSAGGLIWILSKKNFEACQKTIADWVNLSHAWHWAVWLSNITENISPERDLKLITITVSSESFPSFCRALECCHVSPRLHAQNTSNGEHRPFLIPHSLLISSCACTPCISHPPTTVIRWRQIVATWAWD